MIHFYTSSSRKNCEDGILGVTDEAQLNYTLSKREGEKKKTMGLFHTWRNMNIAIRMPKDTKKILYNQNGIVWIAN